MLEQKLDGKMQVILEVSCGVRRMCPALDSG